MSRTTISYPSSVTFSMSIFPLDPTNSSTLSGARRVDALAMAIAGKICPPVPPPLMMIRFAIAITSLALSISSFICIPLAHRRNFADNHFLVLLVWLFNPLHLIDITAHAQDNTESEAGKRSEEHTYELQSLMRISYAVF